jgi:GNAT superfamily N-acetyltransferase
MTEIPGAVRRQALNPFRVLPVPKNVRRFPLEHAVMSINPHPGAQVAFPTSLDVDVPVVVEEARTIARANDRTTVAWWIEPEHASLVPAFEALGIVNADTPGFEAIENAMALVEPPAGERPAGIEVRRSDSFEDYLGASHVITECFGYPPQPEEVLRERWEEQRHDDAGAGFVALAGGRVIGNAFAAFGDAGLNLFGGSVLPEARGKGVYRALMFVRWDEAVERGTPALTVQAGKMSMPICERLGFQFIGRSRVFVDELSS